ncbi:MAG: DNA mismatch repair endonuclease MutL, partial [Bacteroidota bacterium]
MSAIIQMLPNNIANQIAAGEVVQRPASVVKELVENAIDAGSSTIKVVIKDAGKTLIQVIDNGSGMSEVDARMSFEKHATSKIRKTEDLFNIQTMGFRGEALASIAAVAQLEMETCPDSETLGTRIVIEGAEFKSQTSVAASRGTKISVKNLFFNVPARRNFLKSNPVETKHIIDELQRAALARPDIAFSFYQNEQEVYQLPITKLSHRIVHLFGDTYKQQLIPCQEETPSLKLRGYVGKPAQAKKTRGEQFFFVNQRFIKSPYLNHAVTNAFEGLLSQGTFPFYVLFIEIDPQRIDVNVHPTKTEIKFEDE